MRAEIIRIPELARAEARLIHWMMGSAGAGVLAILFSGHARAAAAFALGAALGILNYSLLHQAIETLFVAGHARVPRKVVTKFAVRYPLAFGAVYLFHRTGWLPILAVSAGLFVPICGILIEAVVQICRGLRET